MERTAHKIPMTRKKLPTRAWPYKEPIFSSVRCKVCYKEEIIL